MKYWGIFLVLVFFSSGFGQLVIKNNTETEIMRVTDDGNVGIGTANPQSKLEVKGENHQIRVTDVTSDKVWTLTTFSDQHFGIYEDGTTARITFREGGNVGIGTTDPAQKLHIEGGNIRIGGVGNGIELQRVDGFVNKVLFVAPDTGSTFDDNATVLTSLGGNGIHLFPNISSPNNGLTVDYDGRVGIGTIYPDNAAALDVNGKTKTSTIQITGGNPGSGRVLTSDASGNGSWQSPPSSSGIIFPDQMRYIYLWFPDGTSNIDLMRVYYADSDIPGGIFPGQDINETTGAPGSSWTEVTNNSSYCAKKTAHGWRGIQALRPLLGTNSASRALYVRLRVDDHKDTDGMGVACAAHSIDDNSVASIISSPRYYGITADNEGAFGNETGILRLDQYGQCYIYSPFQSGSTRHILGVYMQILGYVE
ncbi:hypothetical protein GF406_01065 [candidate division KSB1 bacterium]|nr:hypothetical protein [candidate division KSB1 bacterium]